MSNSNTVVFTVMSSTSSKNGGFVTKIQSKRQATSETAFGLAYKDEQETYYLKLVKEVPIGTEGPMNLDNFVVTKRPYTIPSGDKAGEIIDCKWLSPKA